MHIWTGDPSYLSIRQRERSYKDEWKERTETWPEAELVATKAGGVPDQITDRVSAELMCVFRAERDAAVLHQPGGHFDDAGGLPSVPHVRDAIGGGPQMPQMQEHCFARCHPRHRCQEDKEDMLVALTTKNIDKWKQISIHPKYDNQIGSNF